ncbi:hypothetical protein [Streptomyces sp. NPDC049970]|uniref:hypothetical protein n=1 Tax=Streptomyces sp. NPDC049970 TaxID=3155033 RepID=UPI00342319F5
MSRGEYLRRLRRHRLLLVEQCEALPEPYIEPIDLAVEDRGGLLRLFAPPFPLGGQTLGQQVTGPDQLCQATELNLGRICGEPVGGDPAGRIGLGIREPGKTSRDIN